MAELTGVMGQDAEELAAEGEERKKKRDDELWLHSAAERQGALIRFPAVIVPCQAICYSCEGGDSSVARGL